ncbi:hypothetical protein E2C01_021943 [Portunus trituberculatus]|uniref:Uncharacterized protein n=1 Tax=Portunus trituberculatus TaxID=210409 RepID=A0A5B7E6B4_PORTR|nr:hypothetical protein [Portunus trituberculatus]
MLNNNGYSKAEIDEVKKKHNNVKPVDPNSQINLIIYYKTKRTSSLILKNNCHLPTATLQELNVVYQYTCHDGDCNRRPSIRILCSTITTLSKRITAHLQDGAIKMHHVTTHADTTFNHKKIEENAVILHKEPCKARLRMTEAVYIYTKTPSINIQLILGAVFYNPS